MPAKKKTAKKATKKPVAKKKTAKKKVALVAAVSKPLAVKAPLNKTQVVRQIAEATCLKKADVVAVMSVLGGMIEAHLNKRGPGEFALLGLAKFRVIHKPATKARKGVNPFTGEPATFAAKPARNIVKIRPLKKLKEMVA